MVVWSPLAGGFLTGKYTPGERTAAGTRSAEGWAYPQRYFAPTADQSLTTLLQVAREIERSPAQVALCWVLAQPAITSAIIGARTAEQARNNILAGGWHLPPTALQRLNEISQLPPRYPRSMEENMHERRNSAVQTKRLS